ncbi:MULTISPECIES: type II toxin-antitoxin system VapC family toxin [Paraburkholderia]|uniref:Ribonuclease VapC n=3 Tax=Paraburkholderia TaxID=1822464 RepID=A0A4P7D5X3_9BURK|nr:MULTISPECIES: type II toxin-antitoxin system VapC family toxin [Paraburkholderia]QBR04176.1 type II toxin-antitoxin system VapC family toxin [Paraburkholderia pallida]TDG21134.1 type II toxin-antitoxin system VapC family toxin [Paraburkholderia silviterrae]
MIVLDTNVLSELLRPAPEPAVLAWFGRQPRAALFTTTLSRAEMLYGVNLLPAGARREGLAAAIAAIFDVDFAGRVLPFDWDAADAWAVLAAERRLAGQPVSQVDAMIAAIARSRGAAVATRNVKDFAGCGVDLDNPWLMRGQAN